jgi:hypothetical protein
MPAVDKNIQQVLVITKALIQDRLEARIIMRLFAARVNMAICKTCSI